MLTGDSFRARVTDHMQSVAIVHVVILVVTIEQCLPHCTLHTHRTMMMCGDILLWDYQES